MREIPVSEITEAVKKLCISAITTLIQMYILLLRIQGIMNNPQ